MHCRVCGVTLADLILEVADGLVLVQRDVKRSGCKREARERDGEARVLVDA